MKTVFVFVTGVALGGAGVWLSPRQPATAVAANTLPQPLSEVVAAAQGRVEGKTGNIEVGASTDGVIQSLLVKEGQEVSKNQVIGEIACDNFAADVQAMEASLESARQARVRLLRGSRDEERQVAAQEVAAAQANVDQAQRQDDRMQALAAKDDVSKQAADIASRDLATAEAALKSAVQKQRLANAGPLPEEVGKADADVAAAEDRLRAAMAQREKCVIRAPLSGAIIRVNMRAGEAFSAVMPRPIVTIADLSETRIRAEVDERDVAKVKVNQRVRVTAEGFAGPFNGKVVRTSAMVGRRTARSNDPTEKSDRDILETLIAPDAGAPRLPVGLRVVVEFLEAAAPEPASR